MTSELGAYTRKYPIDKGKQLNKIKANVQGICFVDSAGV